MFLFGLQLLFSFAQTNGQSLVSGADKLLNQHPQETPFRKALFYYREENWDSVLVYSMKELNRQPKPDLQDYCHYFRGMSFRAKNLFPEAQQEFRLVSTRFPAHYKVKLNLAEIALEQNRFRQALGYYQELEPLAASDKSYDFEKSAVYHNLGLCYFHLQQYAPAERYLSKATALQLNDGDSSGLIASYMDLGNLYYEQYRDEQAIAFFKKAYALSKHNGSFELKQNAAINMAVVEENRKQFPLALAYRREYESWRDSLTDQNKIWQIADLEKQFAVQQKQKQVDVLKTKNALKIAERNSYLIASVLLALLLGATMYFYRQKSKRSRIILAQKTELDDLNATKDKLFSIVSHDLRSSVHALKASNASLSASLETGNYEQLDQQLQHNSAIANGTYGLLDNLLHWALLQTEQSYFQRESLPLFRIAEQVAYNYKPLMSVRNMHFENTIPKDANVFADPESLKIVLRNLIDNSIKFSADGGRIRFCTRDTEDNYIVLVIEDSGSGMSETTRQELLKETVLLSRKRNEETLGTGLGLQLCKSMIRKNGGIFGIESQEGCGTKVIISLPKSPTDG